MHNSSVYQLAIVGAGFSGTSLALNLKRFNQESISILLCDKNGEFGVGEAYRTPYPFHLLNVRAQDMSAFVAEPNHFVNWLQNYPSTHPYLESNEPISTQFVPRMLYRDYLQSQLKKTDTHCVTANIRSVHKNDQHYELRSHDQLFKAKRVVFALGNNPASAFPFPVQDIRTINNPWDYRAPEQISKQAPVLIVGTGLSMIDTVLTLHHQGHQGLIYAVSRHGFLPLPHQHIQADFHFAEQDLPKNLRHLTSFLRQHHIAQEDWRAAIHAIRPHTQRVWQAFTLEDKKRFLRHSLSYWNIHRHRVHDKIFELLQTRIKQKQLHIIAGRVEQIRQKTAMITLRHQPKKMDVKVDWVINCLGPKLNFSKQISCVKPLVEQGEISFDALNLGFNTTDVGQILTAQQRPSQQLFSLGPPTKGVNWECVAVPDIRQQSAALAHYLMSME